MSDSQTTSRDCSRARHECPECDETYDTPQGLGAHRHHAHGRRSLTRRKCPECEEEFDPDHGDQTYCSPSCVTEASRNYDRRECPQCHGIFEVPAWREKTYCDHECASAAQKSVPDRTCANCGTEFHSSRPVDGENPFCSRKCVHEHQRTGPGYCTGCGTRFPRNRSRTRFCSRVCAMEWVHRGFRFETEPELLHEIYIEDDLTINDAWRRYNCIRRKRGQERVTYDYFRALLDDYRLTPYIDRATRYISREDIGPADVGLTALDGGDNSWKKHYHDEATADD